MQINMYCASERQYTHGRTRRGAVGAAEIISSSKRGKWHLQDSTFQNFPGGDAPGPPYNVSGL